RSIARGDLRARHAAAHHPTVQGRLRRGARIEEELVDAVPRKAYHRASVFEEAGRPGGSIMSEAPDRPGEMPSRLTEALAETIPQAAPPSAPTADALCGRETSAEPRQDAPADC